LKSAVCDAATVSPAECKKMAKAIYAIAGEKYNQSNFSKRMRENLENILNKGRDKK